MSNDPVLKAIDKMVNEAGLDIKCSMGIRTNVPQKTIERHAEAIRKAYLASINTGKLRCPHCAGELRRIGISGIGSIYRCPDCNKIWNINEQEEA